MKILYVVRRYGPVGGMERYVWELTCEVAALGHQVVVICERCHTTKPKDIAVYELGEIIQRPRWLSLLRFSRRVAHWLKHNPHSDFIIHSHERLYFHHVTTFHGPPFATVRTQPWWKRASLRVAMQFYLERRELSTASCIIPNSNFIKSQLAQYYPEFAHKLTDSIVPGVAAMQTGDWFKAPSAGGIVGFIGKEWQRKGLPLAVEICRELKRERPNLELWVIGPQPEQVQHLFTAWQSGYRLLGWRKDMSCLSQIDVLLHPARVEPYGMVITEALAARVSVVVSDMCGAAAQVDPESGTVVRLDAPLKDWIDALRNLLKRDLAPPTYTHGWAEVALEHIPIYQLCSK